MGFPNKDRGFKVDKVICENGVSATWDDNTWGLIDINNPTNQERIKCSVNFKFEANSTLNYDYTGNEQIFIVPETGRYKIELWGAQGGSNKAQGGLGGYTSGIINLSEKEVLYIYVGGEGETTSPGGTEQIAGGYNGGGSVLGQAYRDRQFGSGGGATDVRLVNGPWNEFNSLTSRIMVAAGGGGAYSGEIHINSGGAGGGLEGIIGEQNELNGEFYCYGTGGSQINGGDITTDCNMYNTLLKQGRIVHNSGFGYGGFYQTETNWLTGGGGGYYGGGQSGHIASAGGGSSFISGHEGCNAIEESSTATNIQHTGKSIHYSGLYFTETKMVDGAGYSWTTEKGKKTDMPKHDGSDGTMVGNSGNGYAKITYLG